MTKFVGNYIHPYKGINLESINYKCASFWLVTSRLVPPSVFCLVDCYPFIWAVSFFTYTYIYDGGDMKISNWIYFNHQTFPVHYDYDKIYILPIDPPITSRFVRINPNAWIYQKNMKFDLYGYIIDNATTKSPLGRLIVNIFRYVGDTR